MLTGRLGHRYALPFAATCALLAALIPGSSTAAPAGWVVWASNREDGRHEIYRMNADGTGIVRLTHGGGKYPVWSPDGQWIGYHHSGDNGTHVMRADGADDHKVCDGAPVFWLHDGGGLVCGDGAGGYEDRSRVETYFVVDANSGERSALFRRSDFAHLRDDHAPAGPKHLFPGGMSTDRRWISGWVFGLFRDGYPADNGEFKASHATVLLDRQDPSKLYFVGPGCTNTISPLEDVVFHVTREGPTAPDIFRLHIDDLQTRSSYSREVGHADAEWGHEYFPRVSTDGRWITYAASTGCHPWYDCDYDIFLHAIGSGGSERARLTLHPANDNYPHLYVPLADGGSDAAPPPDAGPADPQDGGNRPTSSPAGGCMITATSSSSPAAALVLVLGLVLLALRERALRVKRRRT